jgi:hypothetical protein
MSMTFGLSDVHSLGFYRREAMIAPLLPNSVPAPRLL